MLVLYRVAFFTAANGGNKVDKKEALRMAKEMEEREDRDVSVIKTISSKLLFHCI